MIVRLWPAAVMLVVFGGCRDRGDGSLDSARGRLPPVYPSSPLANTNWDVEAGPLMIVSTGVGANDTAAVVLPEATDSTIGSFQGVRPPVSGLSFDLFARSGKLESRVMLSPISVTDSSTDCYSWPLARVSNAAASWRVGFVTGRAMPVKLDSIETLASPDSAGLAAAITRLAATLPAAADPAFRGLPFRVRSAYSFTLDSTDVVIADVVRSVNEEANPRVEYMTVVGERRAATRGKFDAAYYDRVAGPEDSVQAMDILAVVQLGREKRTAIVVGIDSEEGGRIGLIERTGSGRWNLIWKSAYTDC